jgi:ABC-type bacteriocin/lantibiotic exporter with double-glycine peptidase domain
MKKLFKLFYSLDLNFSKNIFFLIFCSFLNILLEFFSLASIYPLLNSIFKSDNNLFGLDAVINKFLTFFQIDLLTFFIIIVFIFFVLKNIFNIISIYISTDLVNKIYLQVSYKYFGNSLNSSYLNFISKGSNIFLRDQREVMSNFRSYILSLISFYSELLMLLTIVIVLLFVNFINTIIIIFLGSAIVFLVTLITKTKIKKWSISRNESAGELNKIVLGAYNSIREIIIFSKSNTFLSIFNKNNLIFSNVMKLYDFSILILRNIFELIIICFFIAFLLLFNSKYNINDYLPILGIYFISIFRIYPTVNRLISSYLGKKNNTYTVDILLSNSKNNNDISKYIKDDKNLNYFNDFRFEKKIELKSIFQIYNNNKKNILNNVTVDINKGDFIGITGNNGSGKSTLCNIILGLIKPTSGTVRVDGKFDIFENYNEYKKLISFVPQNIYLINDTIRNNIKFEIEEPIDFNTDNKIYDILSASKFYSFIFKLDNSIDTLVKENGSNFSGGQRQTIAIARSLYKNPSLLILDEPTSALDQNSEKELMEYLKFINKDITIIIVSHNSRVINYCNKVINMQNGYII